MGLVQATDVPVLDYRRNMEYGWH